MFLHGTIGLYSGCHCKYDLQSDEERGMLPSQQTDLMGLWHYIIMHVSDVLC